MTQQAYYPQAPAPQGYPPVAPVPTQPQYPQQVQQPIQYEQPTYPGYPQQPYAAPPAQPSVPLAQGSLDEYYSQPSTGGGAGLKFTGPNNQPLIGQSYVVQVTRPITAGDIQQQTDQHNRPLFWKDGRPKFVMIVPVQLLEPSPNHPNGLAKWYVKGGARDELVRAMAEAGAPEGPPEYGAVIRVTLTGTRPSGPGMNPAHVFSIQYVRPTGAAPVQPAVPQPAPEPVQAPAPAPAQAPAAPSPVAGVPQGVPQQVQPQQYAQGGYVQSVQGAQPIPAQQQVPSGVLVTPAPPSDLSPEQRDLLARLTAQQTPAQG